MVLHVIEALQRLRPVTTAVVVGHHAEKVTTKISKLAPPWANITFVEQLEQRGTGDAAACGMTAMPGDDLDDESTVVVLPGDTPLLRPETLDELVAAHVANDNAVTILASVLDDPTGYGRIVRGADNRVLRIVEQRDASPARSARSARCARASTPSAATCSVPRCATSRPTTPKASTTSPTSSARWPAMGHRVDCVTAPADETQGVNDRWQLALAERELRARHQPALAAQRRDDARPAPDVHRRHRRSRP